MSTKYKSTLKVLLYDVTTLYFESDNEDEDSEDQSGLRKRGYSKDHRNDLPQVVLGLCVNELGMPISYNLYPYNTYEKETLVDAVSDLMVRFKAASITLVADAGMLNQSNLNILVSRKLYFVISARIKNLPASLTNEILSHDWSAEPISEFKYRDFRLIVGYFKKRSSAEGRRRKRAVERLERLIALNQAVRKHQYLDFSVKSKPIIN